MRLSFLSLLASVAGSLVLSGCAPKPSATPSPAETVVWSQNGWSDTERAEYHRLAEGSELMPYTLLANVVSVKTGKPFL